MTDQAPAFEPTQEVRFATVLYGGVSLAIYINGVVQELLHMVRATAPDAPTAADPAVAWKPYGELSGTERVYRRLGQMLSWDARAREDLPGESDPITTRFVVDILSGSSAGGINGIFLAKALANEQEIERLKRLWIDEGDIAKLIDDRQSYKGLDLKPSNPPPSVLNSRRMYWKLLAAFHGMDTAAVPAESRLVDELDLWVTTTDIHGLLLPIDLYDRVVYEKRHRSVLHLRYGSEYSRGEPLNDFLKENNPFLAFAARCTSAFPFAFEPMTLGDIDEVLRADVFSDYRERGSESLAWRRFFDDYVKARRPEGAGPGDGDPKYYASEAFGDGGYLDNKPFSWATDNLDLRRADLPVDRRLIYVEPDPTDPNAPEAWKGPDEKPDALENVQAAMFTLPRAEPIRDDLERLIKRNREIDRIRDIGRIVDLTADDRFQKLVLPRYPLEEWRRMTLAQMIEKYGCGLQYAAYHRLKIVRALDDLAALVTRANDLNVDSDDYSAVRCLIQAWFERHYREEPEGADAPTENEFLLRFDVGYRQRRLDFMSERIGQLLRFDRHAQTVFARFGRIEDLARTQELLRSSRSMFNEMLVELRLTLRGLNDRKVLGEPGWLLRQLDLTQQDLLALLQGASSKEESVRRAAALIEERELDALLTSALARVADQLEPVFTAQSKTANDTLRGSNEGALRPLRHFYENYESYDAIVFPLSYGAVGETNPVEVIRVSPRDAPSLIDETDPGDGRHKLAGVAIGHFGGFFERAWRRNDLMWGRLDAAERVIDTMLLRRPGEPAHPLRAALLEQAQLAIVEEELCSDDREPLTALMVRTLLGAVPDADGKSLEALVARNEDPDDIATALDASLDPARVLDYLRTTYEVRRVLDRERLLGTIGRATKVTGELLDGVSDRYEVLKKPSRWLVRAGQFLWGLVQVATPRTLPQILFRYWQPLLVLVSLLMIVGGALFGSPGTSKAGWVLLGFVVGGRLVVWLTQDLLRRRRGWIIGITLVAVLIVVVLAVVELWLHVGDDLADLF
jgi:patatin-related protein